MTDEEAEEKPRLTREQKTGFVLLLIFAFLAVGLGFLQIRNTLYAPFALNNKATVSLKDQVNTVDALRLRDTDNDGLSDFDELYIYTTSPYLADTDSDGRTDREEIERGADPLCGEGKDCTGTEANAGSEGRGTTAGNETLKALNPGAPPDDIAKLLTDPSQIRQLLIDSGADQALVQKVSDKDLAAMVNQVLASTTTLSQLQALQNATTTGR